MSTLIHILVWLALAIAMSALAWLYAASWRAVAKALSEADGPATPHLARESELAEPPA